MPSNSPSKNPSSSSAADSRTSTEDAGILARLRSLLSPERRTREHRANASLSYEELEQRKMFAISSSPTLSAEVFSESDQTSELGDVRRLIGKVTAAKDRILSSLQIVHPDYHDEVLHEWGPNHTAVIDAAFADGNFSVAELTTLTNALSQEVSNTLQRFHEIVGEPDELHPSESSTIGIENIPLKSRTAVLQSRLNSVQASLNQGVQTLAYLQTRLEALMEFVDDRTESVKVDFSNNPQGVVPDQAILTLRELGRLKVHHGGSSAPLIVRDALRTGGENGPYATQLLDRPIFITSILVRRMYGGAVTKLHVSLNGNNTYYDLNGSSVVDINQMVDTISLIPSYTNIDEMATIHADVVIPGTGITSEILELIDASQKLESRIEVLHEERNGLLQTGYPTGSVLPPGFTLAALKAEYSQDFLDIQQRLTQIGTLPMHTVENINAKGRALQDEAKKCLEASATLENMEKFSKGSEKAELVALRNTAKQTSGAARSAILDWQASLQELFAEGSSQLSQETWQALRALYEDEDIRTLVDTPDFTTFTMLSAGERSSAAEIGLEKVGGSFRITALRGLDDMFPTVTLAGDEEGFVFTSESGAIDFANSVSSVVHVRLSLSTTELSETPITVRFMNGHEVLTTMYVESSGTVEYDNIRGITAVFIDNGCDRMNDNARQLHEYRQTYRPINVNNDPGPDHYFFILIRPDLFPVRSEVIAAANIGDVYQPTIATDISVVTDLNAIQEADPVTTKSNGPFSVMSSQRINSVQLPNNYWAYPLQFSPDEYNAYSMKTFGGGSGGEITGIGYEAPNGSFQYLTPDMYTIVGDQIVVHPTGRVMHIGAVFTGTIMRSDTPVGYVVNCDMEQRRGATLEEALRKNGPVINVEEIKMFTMNNGGALGWKTGMWLESQGDSPVAIGWLKARARITNSGNESVSFTVRTYSGFPGTSGWQSVQGTYTYALAPGQSRLLTDDIYMYANSSGGSAARFVITDTATGEILAEYLRSVNAPSSPPEEQQMQLNAFKERWAAAMAVAQQQTLQYFASIGAPAPSMGDPATIVAGLTTNGIPQPPSMAEHEDRMRQAFRILAHAIESGDQARIAWARNEYELVLNQYIVSQSQFAATPSVLTPTGLVTVLEDEEQQSTTQNMLLLAGLYGSISNLSSGSIAFQQQMAGNQSLTFGQGLTELLQQYGTELFSFASEYFALRNRTPEELNAAFTWVMQNGEAAQAFTLKDSPVEAVKEMLRRFADDVFGIPTAQAEGLSDTISLEHISQQGSNLQAFRSQLAQEGIAIRTDSLAGRMYLWIAKKLDQAQTFDEMYDVSRKVEEFTSIPWWKIGALWRVSDPAQRHLILKTRFTLAQFSSAFGEPQSTSGTMLAANSNKFDGSSPHDPGMEIYRTFSPAPGRPADQFIRVRFDVAMPSDADMYRHVYAYLYDRNGNEFRDHNGQVIEIRLTPQEVKGMLYIDIPLSSVTKHVALDNWHTGGAGVINGEFRIKIASWMPDSGTVGTGAMTKRFETADLQTPRADISHLPEIDRDILGTIRSPLKGTGWSINMESTAHTGAGAYALDFNATGDDAIAVYSPGRGRLVSANLTSGTVKIEVATSTGKLISVNLLHMDHILEKITGQTYTGLAEYLALHYPTEWAAAPGHSEGKITWLKANNPTIASALVSVENRIAQVQAIIDGLIAQGYYVEDAAELAQIGNEGMSGGAHLDFRVHDNLRPVQLFGWADAYHQGIQVINVNLGNGKVLSGFHYNRELNALANEDEQIVTIRDAASGQNLAYAIENSLIGREIKWDLDNNAWFAWANGSWQYQNGKRLKWVEISPDTYDFQEV